MTARPDTSQGGVPRGDVPRRAAARPGVARLNVLFLAALGGVLLIFALLAHRFGGPLLLGAYLGIVGGSAVVLARRGRALIRSRRAQAADSGRTCSCCTASHYDPVTIL